MFHLERAGGQCFTNISCLYILCVHECEYIIMIMTIQEPIESTLVLANERIVTHNKNNTDVVYFGVVEKKHCMAAKNSNYNSVQ